MVAGVVFALVSKKFVFHGNPIPFVMELPNYRMPSMKTTLLLMWEKAEDFFHRAFSVIFVATIVIWFLQTFDIRLDVVTNNEQSILARVGGAIAPVFGALGFADWRISRRFITGFMARRRGEHERACRSSR